LRANFACRLCDGDGLQFYYALGERYRYYKCSRCGLVNLDVSNGTDQAQYTLELADPQDERHRAHREVDASFAFLSRHVEQPGRLLDIGCGNGRLLYVAKQAGWEVKGVELSAQAAAMVEERLGVEVVTGDFLEVTAAGDGTERYEAICLRHVLEHMADSRLVLSRIRALLHPGGRALIEMPNVEALDKRLKRWAVRHGLHKRKLAADFVAGHCNEFSRRSFEYLLAATGFRLLRWETYSKKRLTTALYRHLHIGNKARALIERPVESD
jgi:2-polyprenyl-3-methyl-5-hydroxy-6-metoxy-1,4-benzoquinol methylase